MININITIYNFINIMRRSASQGMMRASSQSQVQSVNLRQFIMYVKKTAAFYNQLENYKRQLASFLNSIDYTLPFSVLDIDKKGVISQKNMQQFLINNKHFHKPIDIDRYFQKYQHGENVLSFEDIMQCLVPHSDYILMTSTCRNIVSTLLQKKSSSLYLCKRVQQNIITHIISLIIHTQIQHIKNSYLLMDNITNDSLKVGAQLWRTLDRDHNNCVNYQHIRQAGLGFGIDVSEGQWAGFVNWHFRKHINSMNRDDFMVVFDTHINNKRNGSACNVQQFAQKQAIRGINKIERENHSKILSQTADKIEAVIKRQINRPSSCKKLSKPQPKQMINPQQKFGQKILLYTKIGYKNPRSLIKMSEFA